MFFPDLSNLDEDEIAALTSGHPNPTGIVSAVAQHQAELVNTKSPNYFTNTVRFWFVVQLPQEDFAQTLEMHDEIPIMVSKKGKFIGIARTKEEKDALTTSHTANKEEKPPGKYIYLTYKVKISSHEELMKLLPFLHENDMLEPDKTT